MEHIYLDYAAATPVDSQVFSAMEPYFTANFYNPSAGYLAGRSVRTAIDDARHEVAATLGVRPGEIVFTAGATEANNLAIQGIMAQNPGGKVLVSAIEHDSVLEVAKEYSHGRVPVNAKGEIILEQLEDLLTDDVVLVSIMYANNEIGAVQDISKISALIADVRAKRTETGSSMPLYFHTDAAQAPNYLPLHPKRLGVDLMSLNGGKIYGPKQSGALFIASGTGVKPLLRGGGQEFGLRSGTENVPAIIGFSAALQKAVDVRSVEVKRLADLKALFVDGLTQLKGVEITPTANSLHNLVHITIPGKDNERLMMELDERGIQCAVGSACSASNEEPSHVLQAIGMTEEQAQSSLRFSMGRSTQKEDVTATLKALKEVLRG